MGREQPKLLFSYIDMPKGKPMAKKGQAQKHVCHQHPSVRTFQTPTYEPGDTFETARGKSLSFRARVARLKPQPRGYTSKVKQG